MLSKKALTAQTGASILGGEGARGMENEILQQILTELKELKQGQTALEQGYTRLEQGQKEMRLDIAKIQSDQQEMRRDQRKMRLDIADIKVGQREIISDISMTQGRIERHEREFHSIGIK